MKRIIILGFSTMIFLVLLSTCGKETLSYENANAFVEEAKANVEGIAVEDTKIVMDTASYYLLLDVREPNEHHPGYIPGSINLPRGLLEFNITNEKYWESNSAYLPLKEDLILVYCKKGSRAILAASTLQKMGFKNVKYIIGGFKKWELTYPNDYNFDEVEAHGEEEEEVGGC